MDRHKLLRLARNASSLLASDLLSRIATYAIYALVARQLGTRDFGQLSLGLTLLYSFQMLASAGIKTLLTRELAKDRTLTRAYLANGIALVAGMSVLSMLAMALLTSALNYTPQTTSILILLSLNLLPVSITVVLEAVFAGWERMHYIMLANAPLHVLRVGFVWLALANGFGLSGVVLGMVASYILVVLIECALMYAMLKADAHKPTPTAQLNRSLAQPNRSLLASIAKQSVTFLGIDFVIAASASIQYLVISKLTDESSLGLFNAATQLIAPINMLITTVVVSLLPSLARQAKDSLADLQASTERLIQIKLAFMLPLVISLFYLAEQVFYWVYGRPEFADASLLLRIIVWSNLCVVVTSVLGQTLVAGMREKQVLRMVLMITLLGVALNAILVLWLGALGAAITLLVVKVAYVVPHYRLAQKLLPNLSLLHSVRYPLLAAAGMVAWLIAASITRLSPLAISGLGLAVYALVFGLLVAQKANRKSLLSRLASHV